MRIQSQAWLARILSALGAFAAGRRHGEEALRLATLAGHGNTPIIAHAGLGHLYLAQGDLEHAIRVLEQGLALCRASGNRASFLPIAADLSYAAALQGRLVEGRALYQLGVVKAHAAPPDTEQAAAHYRQALALADALGMRPLQAHCHRGLGTLYAQRGRWEQGHTELSTALTMYRTMDMTFWLPETEAALAQVKEG